MPLPNAFLVGSPKSGSTSFHNIIKSDPRICTSLREETLFYLVDEEWAGGVANYEIDHYSIYSGQDIVFESHPNLLYCSKALTRIREICGPDTKMVCLVREPMARAISHYEYGRGCLIETRTMTAVFEQDPGSDDISLAAARDHIISLSRYDRFLPRLVDMFGRDNIHVVDFESFFHPDNDSAMADTWRFLGLTPLAERPMVWANKTPPLEVILDLPIEVTGKGRKPFRTTAAGAGVAGKAQRLVPAPSERTRRHLRSIREASSLSGSKPDFRPWVEIFQATTLLFMEDFLGRRLDHWRHSLERYLHPEA